jgi:hypothetical protein
MADASTNPTLGGLERKLDEVFVKNAPFQLPPNARTTLANYAWLLELIFVIFGAMAFFGLLGLLGAVSSVAVGLGVSYSLWAAWASLLILGAEVVVGAIAVPQLKAMKKSGWNLAFYVSLFNFAYGVFYAVTYANFFNLISQAVGTIVALYLLFQIRGHFKA